MTKDLLEKLYYQWRSNTMSEGEFVLFKDAVTDPANQAILEEVIDFDFHHPEFDDIFTPQQLQQEFNHLKGRLASKVKTRKAFPIFRWKAAAAIIIIIFTSICYLFVSKWTKSTYRPIAEKSKTVVGPGKKGATLLLSDGTQVPLDSVTNGIVAYQGGMILKATRGVLRYTGSDTVTAFNTISVPKGREFSFVLPDDTRVWVNSASSIRYPTIFTGKSRDVTLSGEAYFEVSPNAKQPFRVHVPGKQLVEVLGTSFNINAYYNEPVVLTTVLTGAVLVKTDSATAAIIKAGQQANMMQGAIKVQKEPDIEKVMAWKNGAFNFRNVSLFAAMRQLERWYDIQVIYEKEVPDIELYGSMSKDLSLNDLMYVLEKLGVHYRLESNQLILLP
ncbi:FecR family protein [Chitinophaga sp. RCC_12]|uniref:FecR family protein n=1 Tax=Chitinophaga sp. RCC_12 TaxID=3239226 RepID=UPI003524882E